MSICIKTSLNLVVVGTQFFVGWQVTSLSRRFQKLQTCLFIKFMRKPYNSMTHDNFLLAIWDTSFWNSFIVFAHSGP